ncbi:hypothetical protein ACJX0J_032288, partial [Zea mays]
VVPGAGDVQEGGAARGRRGEAAGGAYEVGEGHASRQQRHHGAGQARHLRWATHPVREQGLRGRRQQIKAIMEAKCSGEAWNAITIPLFREQAPELDSELNWLECFLIQYQQKMSEITWPLLALASIFSFVKVHIISLDIWKQMKKKILDERPYIDPIMGFYFLHVLHQQFLILEIEKRGTRRPSHLQSLPILLRLPSITGLCCHFLGDLEC